MLARHIPWAGVNIRECIATFGLPEPSFAHPPLDISPNGGMLRILCPVCEYWIEIEHNGLLYSFIEGLSSHPQEFNVAQQAENSAKRFVNKHTACLSKAVGNTLIFLREHDELYRMLDPSNRE